MAIKPRIKMKLKLDSGKSGFGLDAMQNLLGGTKLDPSFLSGGATGRQYSTNVAAADLGLGKAGIKIKKKTSKVG